MKALNFLLLCCVVSVCFSCQKSPNPKEMAARPYTLYLSFLDTEGKDLIEGIGGTEPENSMEAEYVTTGEYILTSSPDLLDGWGPSEGLLDNPSPYPKLGLISPHLLDEVPELMDEWDDDMKQYVSENWEKILMAVDGHYQFVIPMTSSPEKRWETITYTLICPYVFGDENAHEIVTYWRKPSSGNDWYSVCYRVEVDGREFTDIVHTNYEELSYVTVVLDR